MSWILDSSTLIALGRHHALEQVTVLDGLIVPPQVREEVTQEPEATNLATFLAERDVLAESPPETAVAQARTILDDDEVTGDAAVIAAVLAAVDEGDTIGVVSDDRRIRTVAEGLGAEVTGTIGVIVQAVRHERLTPEAAKRLVRDVDRSGFHMTGALRDTADELIDQSAEDVT